MRGEIVKYIKEGVSQGHSVDSLKQALIDGGWAKKDVDESANFVLGWGNKVPKVPGKMTEPPMGVKIVSWLHYFMILAFIVQILISLTSDSYGALPAFVTGAMITMLFVATLPILILLGLTGYGIYRGRNGWRIVAIIFGWLSTVIGLFGLSSGSIPIIINFFMSAYIAGYLSFSKECKNYFKK